MVHTYIRKWNDIYNIWAQKDDDSNTKTSGIQSLFPSRLCFTSHSFKQRVCQCAHLWSLSMNQTNTIPHAYFHLYFHIFTIKFKESSIKNQDISQFLQSKSMETQFAMCVSVCECVYAHISRMSKIYYCFLADAKKTLNILCIRNVF